MDSGATGVTSTSDLLLCGVVPVNMKAVTAQPRSVLVRDDCVINNANHTTVVGSRNLIIGSHTVVHGDENAVAGTHCKIVGSRNAVDGSNNSCWGMDNKQQHGDNNKFYPLIDPLMVVGTYSSMPQIPDPPAIPQGITR